MLDSRLSVVILSRGSVWNPIAQLPPYLGADPGSPWPNNATARAMFYDSVGGLLAQVNGTVTPTAISFVGTNTVVDLVPAGANFEIIVDGPDGAHTVRYGIVARREAQFLAAPAAAVPALTFSDSFLTAGLSSKWIPIGGTGGTKVYAGTPNGVGVSFPLFSTSAIRYYTPLNTDNVRLAVTLLNPGGGTTGVALCSDVLLHSYLAVVFDSVNNQIHLATGSAPTTMAYQGAAVANTVANGDLYTIIYTDASKTLAVYKGTNLATPVATWVDAGHVVPHGPGYRYCGLNFQAGLLSQGVEVSSWQAQDSN